MNEVKVHEVLGGAEHLAVMVAARFPEEFAKLFAEWEPRELDKLIEALEERRAKNGNDV